MKLRDPPKKGWKYGKTRWHIYVWSVYSLSVLIVLFLYLDLSTFHDTTSLVFFWITYTLAALYVSIDFGTGPSGATRLNLLALSWGSGVALLVGLLFSYLVLSKAGLKEPYLLVTAVVILICALLAIGLFTLGRKIFLKETENANRLISAPN